MHKEYVERLLEGIDSFDPAKFAGFLTDDVYFRFGNSAPINGREGVESAIASFFAGIKHIKHRLVRSMQCDDVVIAEMQVDYVDQWGRPLSVPVCNLMTVRDDLICDYRIFIDNSALFIAPADAVGHLA